MERLKEKTVAISGGTGGIGKELCRYLSREGANLVLLDRNKKKSDDLKKMLITEFPETKITQIELDLEDFDRVKEVTSDLLTMPIDHLILNAGAYAIPRHKCESGYDNVWQINYLSPFYMAKTLLEKIESRGGKIVAVASIAHRYTPADPENIDFSGIKSSAKSYGNAKRWLMYSLWGLNSKAISVCHPGISFTNITNHYPKLIFALIKHPMKAIFMKPEKACLSILSGLFEDLKEYEWIGPRFFDVWGSPKKKRVNSAKKKEIEFIKNKSREIF